MPWIVAFIPAVIGLALLGWAFVVLQAAREARAWPTVTGKITASGVHERVSRDKEGDPYTEYTPYVRYSFSVNDRPFEGDRIAVGYNEEGSHSQARFAVARYPVGATVKVYYDPANPRSAVLQLGTRNMSTPIFIGIACIGLALFFLFGPFR
jgi:hypothetical protein